MPFEEEERKYAAIINGRTNNNTVRIVFRARPLISCGPPSVSIAPPIQQWHTFWHYFIFPTNLLKKKNKKKKTLNPFIFFGSSFGI